MPAKILLTMIGGPIQGTRYRFDERMLCLIGRAGSCTLQLTGEAGEGVSRHHCLLDLQPPSAFIRDLASRNGTLLNGVNIGKTERNQDNSTLETHSLASGDVFQIGRNVFRIELFPALKCRICHKVLPDGEAEVQAGKEDPEGLLCPQCRAAGLKTPVSAAAETLRIRNCRICGVEFTTLRNTGESLCQDCRKRVPDAFSTWKMPENAEAPDTLLHIPGYKVLRQIGRGGMGAVYLAQSRETLEKVAVKVLLPDVGNVDGDRPVNKSTFRVGRILLQGLLPHKILHLLRRNSLHLENHPVLLLQDRHDLAAFLLPVAADHFDHIAFLDVINLAALILDCHQSTSGASDMIFMKFFSRSSRATGPKIRVPFGFF